MPIGDVHVLNRLEKADRRADRAARRLIRKLSHTKRNKKAANYPRVTSPHFHATSFASATNLIYHESMVIAKRRLNKARDTNGNRAFYVDELACDLDQDEPLGLVVMPRSETASPALVGSCITKDINAQTSVSTNSVTVLLPLGTTVLQNVGERVAGNSVALCKLHVSNGVTLFYAYVQNTSPTSQPSSDPWCLGLDRKTTKCIQGIVARMLGAKFEE